MAMLEWRDSDGIRYASWLAAGFAALMLASAASIAPAKPSADDDAPSFSGDGKLARHGDYREWVHVSSGLGMTYGPAKAEGGAPPRFDNVYVTRAAHRSFLKTGAWPDRTMFMLEVRKSEENVSINNGGRSQGELLALEAAVKDRSRYPAGGWAYFSFDGEKGLVDSAEPLPATASCYSCHKSHAAVDNTFVQFYPTLFEVANRKGTVKADYDPKRKP